MTTATAALLTALSVALLLVSLRAGFGAAAGATKVVASSGISAAGAS